MVKNDLNAFNGLNNAGEVAFHLFRITGIAGLGVCLKQVGACGDYRKGSLKFVTKDTNKTAS